MPIGWLRRQAGAPAPPPAPSPSRSTDDDLPALRASLRRTVATVNRAADRLPDGAVPRVRAIEDQLVELLDHEASTSWSSISGSAQYALSATIEDYLPTTVTTFLALPDGFASTHRNAAGRTPGEELLEQLRLLDAAVRDLVLAVYSGDAERLTTQGRFLDTKFSRSDLDLA